MKKNNNQLAIVIAVVIAVVCEYCFEIAFILWAFAVGLVCFVDALKK